MQNNFNDTENLIILEHKRYLEEQIQKANARQVNGRSHTLHTHSDIHTHSNLHTSLHTSNTPTFSIRKKSISDSSYDIINDAYRINSSDVYITSGNIWFKIVNNFKIISERIFDFIRRHYSPNKNNSENQK